MIVVANRIPIAPGKESEFEERFKNRAGLVDQMPGFIRNEVLRPLKGDYYVVKTYWQDRKSYEAWTESDSFHKAHSKRPPKELFAGPNVFEMHEVIQSTEG